MYEIFYTETAVKHIPNLKSAGLDRQAQNLIEILKNNPFQNPPPYEKLLGDLKGAYSRRINRVHRLVYKVDLEKKTVTIISMWTHYDF